MTTHSPSPQPDQPETPLPGMHRLTASQKAQFERNGYFIIRGALTPMEVEKLLATTDRADREISQDQKGLRKEGDPLELRNAITFDESIFQMLMHNVGFALMLDLMGPSIQLTTSHLFIRPPSPAGATASFKQIDWHRDGPNPRPHPVNGTEPWLYSKIGYFLTDTTIPDAGALRVVPGSHRYGGAPPSSGDAGADPYGAIEAAVKPGDAVIFENRLLHAVGPNFSTVARKNLYMGYSWRWLRPIDYHTQSPEILARANRFERQLLGDAETAFSHYANPKGGLPLADWKPGA